MPRRVVFGLCVCALAACSSEPPPEPAPLPCAAGLSATCAPQYDPPTFATIHAKILRPSCATGASCHTGAARRGDLALDDEAASYAMLLGKDGSRARVAPGDPSCSLLMKRVTSTDPAVHMPPGSGSLSAGEICTLTQWIAKGAPR